MESSSPPLRPGCFIPPQDINWERGTRDRSRQTLPIHCRCLSSPHTTWSSKNMSPLTMIWGGFWECPHCNGILTSRWPPIFGRWSARPTATTGVIPLPWTIWGRTFSGCSTRSLLLRPWCNNGSASSDSSTTQPISANVRSKLMNASAGITLTSCGKLPRGLGAAPLSIAPEKKDSSWSATMNPLEILWASTRSILVHHKTSRLIGRRINSLEEKWMTVPKLIHKSQSVLARTFSSLVQLFCVFGPLNPTPGFWKCILPKIFPLPSLYALQ